MGKLKLKRPQNISFKNMFSKDTYQKVVKKCTAMFGSDYRSMALFRVAMALCVIGDVIERATDLRVMYSEYGIMPRHLIIAKYSSNYFAPIHLINTSVHFQALLFALHIAFASCMLVGYRTKLFSILTWFMTISLQAYVGVVGHGGDVFFRMMLFLNIFIPNAHYFSIDNATFFSDNQQTKSNVHAVVNLTEPDHSLLSPLQQQQQLLQQQQQASQQQAQQILQQQQGGDLNQPPLSPLQIQHQQSLQQQQPLLTKIDGGNVIGSNETDIEMGEIGNGSDRVMTPKRDPDFNRFLSFGTACVILQMGCMYVASYFHKTGIEWENGEATFYAITLDYFATDFARFLLNFRTPLRLLTIAVAKWELLGIFFIVSPIFTDWFRLFGAIGFIAMHAGFVACLRLGLFFFVTACAQFINVPTSAWEVFFAWTDKKILKGQRPTRVYYNITSPISQKIALVLKTFFIIPGHAQFSPLDHMIREEDSINGNVAAYSLTSSGDHSDDDNNNNVDSDKLLGRRRGGNSSSATINGNHTFVSPSSMFGKKDLVGDDWLVTIDANGIRKRNIYALNYIASKSVLLLPFSKAFSYVPANVCEMSTKVMQLIHSRSQQSQVMSSGKRSLYQKKKNPAPPPRRIYGILNNIWMAFLCWFILSYNFNTFKINFGYKYEYNQMAYIFRIDQGWNMFSPAPPKTHWWHVIHGELDDGTKVELFKDEGLFKFEINKVVNFDKPDPFYKSYGNHRWFKYWENGFNSGNSDAIRLELGRYICREFNTKHSGDEMLYKFTIYFVHEFQHLDGTVTPSQHQSLWNHICYEK